MSRTNTLAPETTTTPETLGIRMRTGRGAADKFLSFELHGQAHAIPILRVKEIIRMMRITQLPHAADYVRGIVNLRGKVIPVLDLRSKFGLPPADDDKRTCIVVAQAEKGQDHKQVGLVVDQVDEVLNIPADSIEQMPGRSGRQCDLHGVGKVGNQVVLIVDIDGVLGEDHGIGV
ncbi:MAG: chemotaxis protein CheW [Planctomycetes bacterium]|nr:chemotaxis protein CheW [Planctomycetota bacterium]